jgi:hypothetical protein
VLLRAADGRLTVAGDLHEISAAIGRLTGMVESMKDESEARELRIRGDFKDHRERIHAEVGAVGTHVAKIANDHLKRIEAVEKWQTNADTERRINKFWMTAIGGAIGSAITMAAPAVAKKLGLQ